MQLSSLLKNVEVLRQTGPAEAEVTGVFCDSRQVAPGGVFFALPGTQVDGHRFIPQAIQQGATVVVYEQGVEIPPAVTGIQVESARRAMARLAQAFYGDPTAEMLTIGVTGTNGKTTVCTLLEQLLLRFGRKPAVIGTIDYRFGAQRLPSSHTTPESIELMKLLADFRRQGADALIMEVSSHALEQFRADGIRFDQAIFTNLTPEHLDYHGTMEAYFDSKKRLFTELLKPEGTAILNIDDPYGVRLAEKLPRRVTVGQQDKADIHSEGVVQEASGIRGCLVADRTSLDFASPLVGAFNLSNLLCAYAAALTAGMAPRKAADALTTIEGAPGRLQRVDNALGALILVDYAHTGDALEKALKAVQHLKPRRLITVFGCGGDRDTGKRPVMGRVAAAASDMVILTSDNPRTEDPLAILAQIRPAVEATLPEATLEETGRGYAIEPDRRRAIERAVGLLQPGDLLLLAGKGHEDYQVVGTDRFHFDDVEEVKRALAAREAGDAS